MLLTPSPCHKLSHLLGPPLERDVLNGWPHEGTERRLYNELFNIRNLLE